MILNMKRKRIVKEREEAVPQRERAARDFVAAIREAEAALDALKAANDRFYRSDVQHEQSALNELRRSRDRMFQFTAAKDVVAEAPHLARPVGRQGRADAGHAVHRLRHPHRKARPQRGRGLAPREPPHDHAQKRHRMTNLRLREISTVDWPAQTRRGRRPHQAPRRGHDEIPRHAQHPRRSRHDLRHHPQERRGSLPRRTARAQPRRLRKPRCSSAPTCWRRNRASRRNRHCRATSQPTPSCAT